jgi:hypothetical protein
MVPTERNPKLHGILFQAKVPWDYLSKPQVIAYLVYSRTAVRSVELPVVFVS